jgi:hypothetical protein
MRDYFPDYKAARDAYTADIEPLTAISERLVTTAKASKDHAQLQTNVAQMDKLPQSFADAKNRYQNKIDLLDEDIVNKFRGLCAYALATGQADAGIDYLYGECKAFDAAKGDF